MNDPYTMSSEDIAFVGETLCMPAPQPGHDLDMLRAEAVVLRVAEDELRMDDVFIKTRYIHYDEVLMENWWDNEYLRVSTGQTILVRNFG